MDIAKPTISRHDQGKKGEYHAHIDGVDAYGRLTWVAREQGGEKIRVARHTLVPKAIGGRGVAALLVDALVADARKMGFKIDPQCSYVVKKFEQHPEWASLKA